MENISFLRNGKEFEPTKNELKIVLNDYAKKIGELETKLAEFEDFMEEKGFESLEELKDSYETIKKSQASTHSALMTINEELVGTRQFIIKQTKENQALKSRWEKLKKFVNTPKEIQQWDERFEVTVDSIKAKMQELELTDLVREKEK